MSVQQLLWQLYLNLIQTSILNSISRRTKIAHDPRNLAWSQTSASTSFGHRLMQQQGWKEGQSLGARDAKHIATDEAARLQASRVGVLFKDDTLGLGAQLKSKDVESQRTGLDAFQGLLGRLNGKSEEELKAVEKKVEDRKLAMYAQGRWGGMVFVPGGVLVQRDPFKELQKKELDSSSKEMDRSEDEEATAKTKSEKKKRKEEKRQRKEEKKAKKAAKLAASENGQASSNSSDEKKSMKSSRSSTTQAPDEPVSSAEEDASESSVQNNKSLKRSRSHEKDSPAPSVTRQTTMKNGRHILRGRNIQAKKMAFSDMKGLDEVCFHFWC